MMRIVFATYNLSLINNWIVRLIPYMPDCSFYLLNIGKLQNKKANIIHGIAFYDISSYSFREVDKLIDDIRPHVVIIFSFRSLFELFFQRICLKKGIRQVYLEHGIFSQTTTRYKKSKLKTEFFLTIKRQFKLVSLFINFAFHSGNVKEELLLLYRVYYKGKFYYSQFDHFFLYGKRSFDRISKLFNLSEDRATFVGYPIFSDDYEKKDVVETLKKNDVVLYVHQPFILDGFTNINYDSEKVYISNLNTVLLKKYSKLVVLLHPRESLLQYRERFIDTNIEFIQSPNNYKCFSNKSLVLGHFSTALLYALYFNIATAIIDYPGMRFESPYKECFKFCHRLDELTEMNFKLNESYRDYFLGPVNTYENIAKEILYYLNKNDILTITSKE